MRIIIILCINLLLASTSTAQISMITVDKTSFQKLNELQEGVYYDGLNVITKKNGKKKFQTANISISKGYFYFPGIEENISISRIIIDEVVYSPRIDTIKFEGVYREVLLSDTLLQDSKGKYLIFSPSNSTITGYKVEKSDEGKTVVITNMLHMNMETAQNYSIQDSLRIYKQILKNEISYSEFINEKTNELLKERNAEEEASKKINCKECMQEDQEILKIAKQNFSKQKCSDCVLKNAYVDTKADNNWEIVRDDFNRILRRVRPGYLYYVDGNGSCFLQFVYLKQEFLGGNNWSDGHISFQFANEKDCSEFE